MAIGVSLSLSGVDKTYPGGRQALRGLALTAEPGEWLVLVGPSGCGKTTTLRIIAGLEDAGGSIQIDRQDVKNTPAWRRNVAMVFQRPALAPTHTVRQNLAFGAPAGEADRVEAIAEMLDLAWELERFPHQLSGGQQQRVALGRALARRVPLYLLDEPLGHLDAPLRDQLRQRLRKWHLTHPATVISVTHDPREAWALGDRVAVMWGGRILQIDKPAEIYHKPASGFVARFFSPGPMNFFNVQLRRQGNLLQWNASNWPHLIPCETGILGNGEAVLGLRAEHVRIGESGIMIMDVSFVETTPQGAWVSGSIDGLQMTGWSERLVAAGQKVTAMIDWTQAYLFDVNTDQTLFAPAG
jgi:ABC-type sugar transport system ATPase subunit